VHGIEIIPELNKGYTSDDLDRAVTVFDRNTLKLLKVIKYTGSADLAAGFTSNKEGNVSVLRELASDRYDTRQTLTPEPGAPAAGDFCAAGRRSLQCRAGRCFHASAAGTYVLTL